MFMRSLRDPEGIVGWSWQSIDMNMPKAWKFFEVTHSAWRTLDNFFGRLRSVNILATLIVDVELH
jgi:hypothetical protein